VTDEPDAVTASGDGSLRIGPFTVTGLRPATSVDLAATAGLAMDAVVPGFADAAAVYVLERLLRGGDPRRETGGQVTVRRLGTRSAFRDPRVLSTVFPPGEVIALAAGSPAASCMREGRQVIFTEPDRQTLERLRPADRSVVSQYASFLAAPLTLGESVLGFAVFARTPSTPAFSGSDADETARLTAASATGIGNALTVTRQRAIVEALQRGLLAADPPRPSGCEVAGRCLPAAGQAIGGDWYDIVPLPRGRTGLIVGDVMGHGPEAAAVMAQLRAAAHALAQLDPQPSDLLAHLDQVTTTLRHSTLATCVYAVIDPGRRSCTMSAAGHLPPVLTLPDGTTRVPDLPAGQSLGLGSATYGQAHVSLPPGTIIALYTDGLVETRTRAFDQGIVALRSVLADGRGPLEDICDTLIKSLAGAHEDDITVILARIPALIRRGRHLAGDRLSGSRRLRRASRGEG
jgi:hypothetical protein